MELELIRADINSIKNELQKSQNIKYELQSLKNIKFLLLKRESEDDCSDKTKAILCVLTTIVCLFLCYTGIIDYWLRIYGA